MRINKISNDYFLFFYFCTPMTDTVESLTQLLDMGFIQQVEFDKRMAALKGSCDLSKLPQQTNVENSVSTKQKKEILPVVSNVSSVNSQVQEERKYQIPKPISTDFNETDFRCSLVICPPPEFWEPIVSLKKNHMNPRIKRPPYPHITILAPFVKFSRIEDAKRVLQSALQNIQPFTMEINSIELFDNKNSQTLFLKPEYPSNVLQDIYQSCLSEFPHCTNNDFDPHIGIGFFRNKGEAKRLQKRYQSNWKPMKFVIQELYIMARTGKESPFEVRAAVPLGGKNPKSLHTLVPF